ncbi:restriction endonuclease subunit S, partial [Selenomonas sp.]|uniref:restriction endonuclease subunit S n=1 Tax=Selenomonas sp. TaxID=2053611 RepID=UPI002A75DEC9
MMLATALRKSILQAAIAGQLTEQRKDDGDARDLLAAIRKEKARLVRAGKLKKERPLPEICEDDVPFEIPENWCWARLGDVALKIHYGFTASASVTGNAKLLRITDIQNNHVSWQDVPRCTVAEHALVDYRLQNRDIVIARTGGTIGKSYIVRELDDVAVFASYLIRVIPSAHINESYLKRFMESPLYWKQLEAKSQGTGQPNVNGKALSNLMLPLPPLTEQERIVQFLQSLTPELTKLEADEHELDALTSAFPARMKSSLLLAAMRGELTEREPGDGDARDLLKTIDREKKRLIKEKRLKREKPLPP